jgi:GalNAc-alpha-(1->4)-GalNAc-alpha-(1->3)-diNAcBac-PP-undecaprenol alpha-1,4-N-acetyl-D-galactosaminyltransferase
MKILFLVSSMQGGGAERVAALLSNSWARLGNEIHLMPTFSGRGNCSYQISEEVQLVFLSDQAGANASKISRLVALRRYIRAFAPDVIVSFLPHVNAAAIIASAGTGIPVVVSERVHPPLFSLPFSIRLQRMLTYRHAAAVVAQTTTTAAWLKPRIGKARLFVIPNPVVYPSVAVEPVVAPDSVVPPGRRLLVWAGRFDRQKRPELMVDAFGSISADRPEWDLTAHCCRTCSDK